jgi:hypothetical protein
MHADYQDWIANTIQHSPELAIAIGDWAGMAFGSDMHTLVPGAVFDVFQDTPNLGTTEFVDYLILLVVYS